MTLHPGAFPDLPGGVWSPETLFDMARTRYRRRRRALVAIAIATFVIGLIIGGIAVTASGEDGPAPVPPALDDNGDNGDEHPHDARNHDDNHDDNDDDKYDRAERTYERDHPAAAAGVADNSDPGSDHGESARNRGRHPGTDSAADKSADHRTATDECTGHGDDHPTHPSVDVNDAGRRLIAQ